MTLEAVLWDLDGVLADVSQSYRQAIIQTAAFFQVPLTQEDIAQEKAKGNANNDWALTQRLLKAKGGVEVTLEEVTAKFEELYQGTESKAGLWTTERLIVPKVKLIFYGEGWDDEGETGRRARRRIIASKKCHACRW